MFKKICIRGFQTLRVFFRRFFLYGIFIREFLQFKKLSKNERRFELRFSQQYPCLDDRTKMTSFDPHYAYHLAWAARVLAAHKPEKHVDISSGLPFSLMVSAFIPVEFYDIRPVEMKLPNLSCGKADLVELPFADNSIKSLSCMHTIEHVGLGRYGDALDPNGDIKAMKELQRVLAPGGLLLFVVPVGQPKMRFNAHRIYSYEQVCSYFKALKLVVFDLLPDDHIHGLIHNADERIVSAQRFGCGCFLFTKV